MISYGNGDVKVFFGKRPPANRIQASRGIRAAGPETGYVEGAVVPYDAWYFPSQDVIDTMSVSDVDRDVSLTLGVVALPDAVVSSARKLAYSCAEDQACLQNPARAWTIVKPALLPIMNFLSKYLETKEGLSILGLNFRSPGLLTAGRDPAQELRFVGLHIDRTDPLNLAQAWRARRRCIINLGKESRSFLFIDYSARLLLEIAGWRESVQRCDVSQPQQTLCTWFGQTFRTYPVSRLRIEPGEALICPNDNIIHEASTLGMQSTDISLQLLGNFRYAAPDERL